LAFCTLPKSSESIGNPHLIWDLAFAKTTAPVDAGLRRGEMVAMGWPWSDAVGTGDIDARFERALDEQHEFERLCATLFARPRLAEVVPAIESLRAEFRDLKAAVLAPKAQSRPTKPHRQPPPLAFERVAQIRRRKGLDV
jgi:hypothetical protein